MTTTTTTPAESASESSTHLEQELQDLPLVAEMRQRVRISKQGDEWYETRPAVEPLTPHSLMASTLRASNLIAIPPLAFARTDESEAMLIYHLGKSLCGHEGIVHGGIVGTILDDSLARNAFLNLPSKTGVTASLNISYLKPTKTDQFIVVKTKLESVIGRKATITGQIEDLEGQVLAKATGLFIEPRNAEVLNDSRLLAIWGQRPGTTSTAMPTGGEGDEKNDPIV